MSIWWRDVVYDIFAFGNQIMSVFDAHNIKNICPSKIKVKGKLNLSIWLYFACSKNKLKDRKQRPKEEERIDKQ